MRKFVYLTGLCVFFGIAGPLFSAVPPDVTGPFLPAWFIPLREAVYEQNLKADAVKAIYEQVKQRAAGEPNEQIRYVILARCEYMMGRAYLYDGRKAEALEGFTRGMDYAEKSLDKGASAAGWQMLAENLSYACTLKSKAWVMFNGLNVEKYSKNALKLDAGNTAAQYMIAARWVHAPSPFNDIDKGIAMLQAILNNFDSRLEKDDRFNVNMSLGYACILQKRYGDAPGYLQKCLEVYPSNTYIRTLLAQCSGKS